ncbi:hypothetical protein Dimus_039326 [Dionaea muscipula]
MAQLTANYMAVGDVPRDEIPRRSTADDLIDEAVAELRRQPERQKAMYAHMMHEMLHPETTEFEEPQVRQNSSYITVKKKKHISNLIIAYRFDGTKVGRNGARRRESRLVGSIPRREPIDEIPHRRPDP